MQNSILILLLLFSISLFSGEPVKIGTSTHPEATAFNNARKIARTSDGKIVVVYQDIVDSTNVVKMTKSEDGINWTEPEKLANGCNPAIAVSESDEFYVIWDDSDESVVMLIFGTFSEIDRNTDKISLGISSNLPNPIPRSFDISDDYIICTNHWEGDLYLLVYRKGTQESWDLSYVRVGTSGKSGPASLVTDLKHNGGNTFVLLWEDEFDGEKGLYGLQTRAEAIENAYYNFGWEATVDERYLEEYNDPFFKIIDSESFKNPSLSYRWIKNRGWSDEILIIGAWETPDGIGVSYISSALWNYDPPIRFNYANWYSTEIQSSPNSFPVVDDVYVGPPSSTAILWQDAGQIKYGQANGEVNVDSVFTLNESSTALYPSVCYKQFRADYFDAVWMEENGDGYDIIYRRFEKYYGDEKYEILTKEVPDGIVGKDYYHPFQISRRGFRGWVENSTYPDPDAIGVCEDDWEGWIGMWPYPDYAGTFEFDVIVGPYLPYIVPALSDTAHFTLTINYPDNVEIQIASKEFALHLNYPNPFNPSTQIQYDLPEPSNVLISIYNINGKLVENLVQKKQTAGSHKITWQADDLPSGTYFIRMQAGEFEQTQKCLLIK